MLFKLPNCHNPVSDVRRKRTKAVSTLNENENENEKKKKQNNNKKQLKQIRIYV